mmetsp:Transcript_22211/g.37626  ORF Transcript_22211/g.37626 Transcript_22211/m.37626 type:complete len:1954 (-) Transcript_22211:181-6042(-)
MLMLKMFTGNNANNASMSSVPTDTGGETSNTSSSPPPPNTTNPTNHNASNNQLTNKKINHSHSESQHSLLTDVAETVYSVNSAEMKNPGTFLHTRKGDSRDASESNFNNLLDENISKLQRDKSGSEFSKQPSRDSDASDEQEEKMKSEKFKRTMLMKKQYSSSRANHGILSKQNSQNTSKELKATQSMAIMIQKANQLDKQRIALKNPTTSTVSNQSKGKGKRKGKSDMRKSSAMVMNMQGLGMNMAEISKNLERTVTRSGSNFSSATTDARLPSHRKMLLRQQGGSIKSIGGSVKGSRDYDDMDGDLDDDDEDDEEDNADDEMDYLLELDCGPNLDNPILSYKQAQRVRAFHMPGLIEADTMTLIQHPLNSKFGWFEFPFRRIFAKDPSPSDMVIEKYGIGVILWFRFLKAFAIVFIVMFVVNVPAMSMFYHGTYYPAARSEKRIDNSPTDILTTTTMGNLGVQLQYCHVVKPGEEIYIDCFGGVVENIIAYYGTPSGECSCPSVQQPKKNGDCPGAIVDSGGGAQECEVGRYNKKLACFDSTFRREKCCGFELSTYGDADLSALSLAPDYTCNSLTAQYIATGMCLGKESCTLGTDATQEYHWEGKLATNLNNSDVCETGFDSGNFNTSDTSFCTTTLGYSGIWDSCPEANTQSLKLNVKCSEKNIKTFGTEMSRPSIVLTASILNALAVSTFIFAVFWVSKQQEAEDAEMDRSTCRATDYTIRCVRLPEHNSSNELANKLKKHFESKLSKCKPCFLPGKVRVADINLTTGSFKYLQAAIKRGKASRDLDLVRYKKTVMDYLNEENSLRYKFFEKWEEHALRTFAKYNDICLKKFVASLNGDKKVIIAYVTFETEEGFLRALANNIPIQGKQMSIKRAEDPTDILWENLGTPVMYRLIRRSITTLLLIVLLLMTYFIVAYAIETSERNSTDWPFIIACDEFVVSLDKNDNSTDFNVITYEKTLRDHKWQYYNNTSGRQGYVNCYCQSVMNEGTVRRALDYVFYDAELDSEERWCKNLLWDEFTLLVIKLAVSMVVLTVNLSAKTILHVLKEFERMASYSLISQSMTVKLFMIQIVNTGMLALLMNGDAGLNKENTVAFMNGDYEDFTPEWYDDIGKTVLQTVTLYCIGVHGVKFAVFFLQKFLRWRDRGFGSDVRITKQVSQENLNKLFIGPEFVIEVRYATVLTICFVCIAYGPAMPLLYLIGGIGFWATYLIDKWFFLRVYRIPHATSPQLAHTVTKSLYFSAILNLLLSVWIYSNIMLFDPVTKGEENEVIVNGMKFLEVSFSFHSYDSVSERIFSQYALASWVVLIPFLLFLFVLLLTYFLNEHNVKGGIILSRFLNMISTERAFEGNPPYFSVIPATLIVRRLEEGMAKPHILAAYEKQLRKVEMEGEEDKLMEGLESYKIELNEIYADKIAINSDYMGKVRPIDLFTEEDELEEVDENSVAGDGSVVNGLSVDVGRMSFRKDGLSRANTMGVGLSGADYEWTVSPDTTPNSGKPEKDIFTLLKEKKQALRAGRKSQGRGGDELKQQSDDDYEDSDEEESSNDGDNEPLIVDGSGVKKAAPDQHPFYTSVMDDSGKKQPSQDKEMDELYEWERDKDKKNSLTDKDKATSRKSKHRGNGNIELTREHDNPNDRYRDKDRRSSSRNPMSYDDSRMTPTTNISSDTGENRRFRRGNHATEHHGEVGDLAIDENIIPKEGGSEKRYYDHAKKTDKYNPEADVSRSEKRRGSHSVDQSRDDSARSSRDKSRGTKSSEKRRRDREDSDERKHRHRHRDRDRDHDHDRERDRDGRRHRVRENSGGERRERESSGGERKHRDRDRREKDRGVESEKGKEVRRHREKEKSRSDKGRDGRDYTKDRDSSRDKSRRKSSHGRETSDGKEKSSRRHQPRRISLPETAEEIVSHRASKKGKELELGFLSASKKTRMERIADNKGVEPVETVSESFSNLF